MTRTAARLATALVLALLLVAPAAAADKVFGEGVGKAPLVKVSELLAHPEKWDGKPVRVAGLVTGVCKKRGCWMEIAGDEEFQSIRFKVDDGVMVFPPEVVGHRAEVEGTFQRVVLSREQLLARARHHAEEHGEEFDPSKIEGPKTFYLIRGTGAVVHF